MSRGKNHRSPASCAAPDSRYPLRENCSLACCPPAPRSHCCRSFVNHSYSSCKPRRQVSAEAENPAPASQAASGVSWTLDDGDLVHLPAATLEPGGGGGDRERYNLAIGARATNGYIPVFKTRHKKETKQAVFEEGMIIFGVIAGQ